MGRIFSWLRRSTRDAILAGVNDALRELQAAPAADDGPVVLELPEAPPVAAERKRSK